MFVGTLRSWRNILLLLSSSLSLSCIIIIIVMHYHYHAISLSLSSSLSCIIMHYHALSLSLSLLSLSLLSLSCILLFYYIKYSGLLIFSPLIKSIMWGNRTIFLYNKQNNTSEIWNYFSCWTGYLTRSLCSLVRYPGQHLK